MKLKNIIVSLAALSPFTSYSQVVTNLENGVSIQIETISENRSKITNLDTLESIEVNGVFEKMTDEQYTLLIKGKTINSNSFSVANGATSNFDIFSNNVKRTFTFKRQEFELPASYISSGSLDASCSFTLGNEYAIDRITVKTSLYKQVDWWADTKIGSKDVTIGYSTTTHDYNWSGLSDGYYYLTISKWINHDYLWVWGECNLSF